MSYSFRYEAFRMQCAWHSASRLGLATSHVLPTTPGCDHQTGQHSSRYWDICAEHLRYASRGWRSKTELSKCIHSCPACRAHWFPEPGGTALASPGTSETAASGPHVTNIRGLSSLYINQNVFLSISVSRGPFFFYSVLLFLTSECSIFSFSWSFLRWDLSS